MATLGRPEPVLPRRQGRRAKRDLDAHRLPHRRNGLSHRLPGRRQAHLAQPDGAQVTFAPLQATNVSGAGSKPIGAVPIWLVADTSSGDALVLQGVAASFQTSATLKDKLVVFEITPDVALDVTNGSCAIAIQTGASNAANITTAQIHILGRLSTGDAALGPDQLT